MMGVRSKSFTKELNSENANGMKQQRQLAQMLHDEVELTEGNQLATAFLPNEVWRSRVLQWYYDVIDHLGASRSIVYIAVYLLDIYVSRKQVLDNRTYQICSLSSLFLAFRMNRTSSIALVDLMAISQINCESKDFVFMMNDILRTVKLCKRLLTPHHFVKTFVNSISMESSTSNILLEEALYNCDMSVSDYNLCHTLPSELAVAAIANAVAAKAPQNLDVRANLKDLMEANVAQANLRNFRLTCSLLRKVCEELHEDHTRTRNSEFAFVEGHCNHPVVAPIPPPSKSIIHVISMDDMDKEQHNFCTKRNMATDDHCRHSKSRRID